ncbi:MAG TPA: hypothetical protein VLG47_04505 [Candidatus Saccharimonadales bacterium]|nr:hypothetical protein [Candidatus Saccharimonadales bacterium]
MFAVQLSIFAIAWISGLYLLNSLIAGEVKQIKFKPMLLYVTTLAMLGVYAEVICDTIYNFIFGKPLWVYTVLPVHHAFTSKFAIVLWGAYGFYLYMMHDNILKRHSNAAKYLPYIFCLEAIVIEAMVNVTFRIFFGHYIFYYLPGDLGHITSLQVLPIYLIGGFVISAMLLKGKTKPLFFSSIGVILVCILVFLN